MDDSVILNFISAINPAVVLDLESEEKLGSYKELLNERYTDFIERVRNNYFELSEKDKNSIYYLRDVIEKLREHNSYLFEPREGKVFYRPQKSLIVFPIQRDNLKSEAGHLQYYYLNKAIRHLTLQQSGITIPSPSQRNLSEEIIGKEEIIRDVLGFRIKNPTNLLGAWRRLRNKTNKFISQDINYDLFKNNFTGRRIKKKIGWIESDKCLHYFIDGIYGKNPNYGLGVEIEEGGQWKKTSDCFCKKDGTSYDPSNLSRTKNPPKAQKDKLDDIIIQMNKRPRRIID